jgi:hypothetical protein
MNGSTVKIVQHDTSVETRVMAFDHNPYSVNPNGAPDEIADAVRAGFGLNIPEFDARQTEWSEEKIDVQHSHRNTFRRNISRIRSVREGKS